jgi:uroporphyrinogen decarboxylase
MTSLERVMTVISGGIPDRVPTALHNFLMAARMAGTPLPQCLRSGELMAASQLQAWRPFKHDILIVENGSAALAEAMGCSVLYSEEEAPRVVGPALKSLGDVEKVRLPDPEKDHPLREMLKAVSILREKLGDQVFIMAGTGQSPFSLAATLRGKVEFFADLGRCEDPFRVERLLEICVDTLTRYATALRRSGADGISIGELESETIPTGIYRLYALPGLKKFFSTTFSSDFPASLHQCGNNQAVLDDMIASGADILELDPRTDVQAAKSATQGATALLGMVDPQSVLRLEMPGVVIDRCREAIEILAPGGGYILGPGCTLHPDTPTENVVALIESARKYGRYKSDGSLARPRA